MKSPFFRPLIITAVIALSGHGIAQPVKDSTTPVPSGSGYGANLPNTLEAENGSSLTGEQLSRRWLHMMPNTDGAGGTWPNGLITWCFEVGTPGNFKDVVREGLEGAWKLWIAAGIDENVLRFREVATQTECNFQAGQPRTMLEVVVEDVGGMSTSIGYSPNGDMKMQLNIDRTFGLGDIFANFAHEIGHAWGLLHEHQRPDMWDSDHGGTATTNQFTFNCDSLKDYTTRIGNLPANQATLACQKLSIARRFDFAGGINYLPYDASNIVSSAGSLDKKSIMLYRSDQGGIDQGNGVRATVYTYADGTFIGGNTQPSAGDVAAMEDLYPGAKADAARACSAGSSCCSV